MDLKHLIFQDEDETKQPETVQLPQPSVAVAPSQPAPPSTEFCASSKSNEMYAKLLSTTDANNVVSLKRIFALATPLTSIIPDQATRLKAALAQSGISPRDASAAVNSLLKNLEAEATRFDHDRQAAAQTIEEGDQKQLAVLQAQVLTIQARIASLQNDMSEKMKGFEVAYNRRKQELTQLKSEFDNLV